MCSSNTSTGLLPYGLKVPNPVPYIPYGGTLSQMTLDLHRAQLMDYSARLQYSVRGYPNALGLSPYHSHPTDPYLHPYLYKDPRARYIHEEPKPNHSYIGLIAMAILSSRDKKLVLSDIYQWILDNYPYFRTRGPGWRNSIRHNLSLNDCFIKSGRSANGKGHYWAIHPANVEDFEKGDFRRRRAQRRVRKHMGLSVPDDEDSPSPSPTSTSINWDEKVDIEESKPDAAQLDVLVDTGSPDSCVNNPEVETKVARDARGTENGAIKRRLFDVESLLAPETKKKRCDFYFGETSGSSSQEARIYSGDVTLIENDILNAKKDEVPIVATTERSMREDSEIHREHFDKSIVVSRSPSPVNPETDSLSKSSTDPERMNLFWKKNGLLNPNSSGLTVSRQSAFHSANGCSWASIPVCMPSYPGVVNVGSQYPVVVPTTAISLETAQRWQQTVSQLVTNSYTRGTTEDE